MSPEGPATPETAGGGRGERPKLICIASSSHMQGATPSFLLPHIWTSWQRLLRAAHVRPGGVINAIAVAAHRIAAGASRRIAVGASKCRIAVGANKYACSRVAMRTELPNDRKPRRR